MRDTYQICCSVRSKNEPAYGPAEEHGLSIHLLQQTDGLYTLAVQNTGNHPFFGVIHLEMVFQGKNPQFFMPAFLYSRNRGNVPPNRNQHGDYLPFPRLSADSGLDCAADHWMVRGDRLSHPVSMAVCGGKIYAVSMQPVTDQACRFNGFSCRLGRETSSVGVTLGYENAPWHYIWRDSREHYYPSGADISAGCITLAPGESLETEVEFLCRDAEDARAVNGVLRHVYARFHQLPRQGAKLHDAVAAIAEAIYQDAYIESMQTYSTRVMLEGNQVRQEPLASIAWTGGVEVAAPMLYAAARLGREDIRAQALSVIEHIVRDSLNKKSGLPFDAFDETRWFTDGWWACFQFQPGHSAYLVGQALFYVLLACDLEQKFWNVSHDDWLDWAMCCLDRIEMTKNEQGEVPYLWSAEDGHALEYDSFGGCWCVAAAAYCDKLRGSRRYLPGCEKSLIHYYEAYVKRMECYGTPLDTQKAVDSEGILAFVKACRLLHEMTGAARWLQMLQDGLEYEFTFKFCWNPPIAAEPLHRIGWTACGGSVTSTCNPHIHPMSNNVADEIAYCFEKTGDAYWKQRLEDTTGWGLQTFSTYDGEYDFGKKGWMSERFCYSEALLIEQYDDGNPCSTWKCFLPWGASNLLEGFCGTVWDSQSQKAHGMP